MECALWMQACENVYLGSQEQESNIRKILYSIGWGEGIAVVY